jgi:DNA-binding SARP family transcriptional activator/tetratricopeptide (TPR) repeat protein
MLTIRVIGELEVRLAGTKVELPASRRARALLGWLAVHPGRHARPRLAGLFWPDVLDASARASLRSAIWALRSTLGPACGSYLAADRDTVSLAGDGLTVDLLEVRHLIAAGQPEEALALCRGELLAELDDDWVLEAREEFERDVAGALRELARRASAAGDRAGAVTWARQLAARCPLDELAGVTLIEALAAAGDVPGALDAFARLQQRLASELDVPVSARTRAVVSRLRGPGTGAGPAEVSQDARLSSGTVRPAAGLAGREGEFASLAAAWEQARSGSGRTVLLEGDGGIGKTRLAEELQAVAQRTGADAAWVAGTSATGPDRAAPLAIWTDVLSDLVTMTGPPPSTGWTADLARVVPAAARPVPGGEAPGPGPPRPGTDPQLDRIRLCEAVVQFLAWGTRERPLLLTIEDLHLADASSLELIAYAGRRIARLPVLLVLTRRRLPSRQDVDAVFGALRARGAVAAEIQLGPLSDAATRAVARASADLPDSTVARIVSMAGGSPLLAVETARAAARDGGDPAAGLAGAARLAISRLSGPARLFVELAAAAGRDLDRAEVAALALANPARAAAEALGSGLLRADDGWVGFRHTLLREAVYRELPDPVLARLHGELARMLRKHVTRAPAGSGRGSSAPVGRGSRRGPRAAEVARHLRLAGQDELAVGHLVTAAADARAVAAMTEAVGFLTEAADIEPGNPELLAELAEVEAWRGQLQASEAAFGRALELISPQDAGALISMWLRRGRWLRGGICYPRESRRSYQNALDVLDRDPGADPPARAEALAGLAWAEAVAGDLAAVDDLLAEVDRVTAGGRPGDLLSHDIGVARGHALIRAGRFADSFAPLIAASAAAGRDGRPDMAYSCLSNAASAAACAGQFDRALDFADRCLALVVPNGLLRLSVYSQAARSAILRRLGRLAEARQACEAAADYASRAGLPDVDGLVCHERGLVLLAGTDPTAAAAELGRALELDAPVSRAATRLQLAEALVASGRVDAAEAELRNVALEPVTGGDFPGALVAQMSRVQGLIASARGDAALATRRLTESVAAWQRMTRTKDVAQAGADYVAALIDLGRPPVSTLVEPARELAVVSAELATLPAHQQAQR